MYERDYEYLNSTFKHGH